MTTDRNTNPSLQPLPDRHPIRRSSAGGRMPKALGVCDSSAVPMKKPPQRGIGVGMLERLRYHERWRKMAGIYTSIETPFIVPAVPGPFAYPALASFQIPNLGGFGAPNISLGQMGLTQSGMGFQGQSGPFVGLVSDQFQAELFGVESSGNSNFRVKTVIEISKELSSTPNPVSFPSADHCFSFQQEERPVPSGENMGCSGVMRSVQISSGDDLSGFLGSNSGENPNLKNKGNQGLGTKLPLFPLSKI